MSAGLVAGPAATERLRAPAAHTLVLSVSALSSDYRKSIERHIGSTPEYLQLANLRRMPLPRLAAFLRSLTPARLYVPIEDQDSAVMRPILECVASFTGADRITVLDADLTPHSVHRHRALLTLFGLAAATIDGRRMRWRAEREASALLRADRTPLALISRGEVAYLNANLWFGVKAGGSTGHIAGVANALHRGGWPVRYVAAVGAAMLDPAIQLARRRAPHVWVSTRSESVPLQPLRVRASARAVARTAPIVPLSAHVRGQLLWRTVVTRTWHPARSGVQRIGGVGRAALGSSDAL